MRFRPDQVPVEAGFSPETDLFEYREFSVRLGRVVQGIEQSATLVLDGPWGSGKSTFIRQWLAELKGKQPYILFDAFANDFFEDAFVPLSAEIFRLASEKIKETDTKFEVAKKSAQKALKAIVPYAAKVGLRAVSFGVVDYSDVEGGLKSTLETIGSSVSDAAEQAAKDMIETAMSSQSVLQKFQEDLTELVRVYRESYSSKEEPVGPVLFVIDELDRCKPTFALNLLERIKHLFGVEGVVFLLATNLKQLEASVCGAYGNNTNAAEYLEKFYDLRFKLPVSDQPEVNADKYLSYLRGSLNVTTGNDGTDKEIISILSEYFTVNRVSFRTMERVYTLVQINSASLRDNNIKISPLISGLCLMKYLRSDLYEKARTGSLNFEEVAEFFNFKRWRDEGLGEWCKEQWRALVGDHSQALGPSMLRISKSTVIWGVKVIDSFDLR